jgi:hypothetical protein
VLLVAGLSGCESLQRKFTRKPKGPQVAPTPIIQFQDYTRAMTPLDRYRKHLLMFDYWSHDLLDALGSRPINPKRYKHSSSESLLELETMRDLLQEDQTARLQPLIEERAKLNRQLQGGNVPEPSVSTLTRVLEGQIRQIHREFSWRDMEEHLKPQP